MITYHTRKSTTSYSKLQVIIIIAPYPVCLFFGKNLIAYFKPTWVQINKYCLSTLLTISILKVRNNVHAETKNKGVLSIFWRKWRSNFAKDHTISPTGIHNFFRRIHNFYAIFFYIYIFLKFTLIFFRKLYANS